MEEESFEDLEVAETLNDRYVAIKVDREERPDVDAVYMTAVQTLTRHGGWPMSVWLDAQRQPFFAGTYFPARDGERGAGKGFLTLLRELDEIYRAEPRRVAEAASSIVSAVRAAMASAPAGSVLPTMQTLDAAYAFYRATYDTVNGGMRGAPKFPSSMPVRLLLRQQRRTGDPEALAMAAHTLERMAAGGMHDQLAGGFHRYSTDAGWLVPHFEKMLYDNALLAPAYVEGWQATKRADFARVARTTLDYILREMSAPLGGFTSATDADSEGEEGTFFVWTAAEIRALLGSGAASFERYYGVSDAGNFEGKNVLYVPKPSESEWHALAAQREVLREAREKRPQPLCDDKVLTAWNGLAISALAIGGRAFDEATYVEAARNAADFILTECRVDGRLVRSRRDGRNSGRGFLEDDAFFTAGLLDVFEATFDVRYLDEARRLADGTEELFADTEYGGWFRSARDHETLVVREKPSHDGAEPSGASVALANVLRLYSLTSEGRYRDVAERAFLAYASQLADAPAALHDMLLAVDAYLDRPLEIVLVWPADASPEALLAPLRTAFLPNRALCGTPEGAGQRALAHLAPIAAGKVAVAGRPTAYVCERGACRLPVTGAAELEAQLCGPGAASSAW